MGSREIFKNIFANASNVSDLQVYVAAHMLKNMDSTYSACITCVHRQTDRHIHTQMHIHAHTHVRVHILYIHKTYREVEKFSKICAPFLTT